MLPTRACTATEGYAADAFRPQRDMESGRFLPVNRRSGSAREIPTRTLGTRLHYARTLTQLAGRTGIVCVADARPTEEALAAVLAYFENGHDQWSPSTIRTYRAAIVYGLEARFGAVSEGRCAWETRIRDAAPRPRPANAPKRTSARKRKSIKVAELAVLSDVTRKRVEADGNDIVEAVLLGMLEFGPLLPLRPVELQTIVMDEVHLTIRAAKATNGRGIGALRSLLFDGDDRERRDLQRLLSDVVRAIEKHGSWQCLYWCLAKRLASRCKEAKIRRICLYTLRHLAIATLKRDFGIVVVAALSGHGNAATTLSYAKGRSGHPRRPIVRADDETIALVRARSRKQHFAPPTSPPWMDAEEAFAFPTPDAFERQKRDNRGRGESGLARVVCERRTDNEPADPRSGYSKCSPEALAAILEHEAWIESLFGAPGGGKERGGLDHEVKMGVAAEINDFSRPATGLRQPSYETSLDYAGLEDKHAAGLGPKRRARVATDGASHVPIRVEHKPDEAEEPPVEQVPTSTGQAAAGVGARARQDFACQLDRRSQPLGELLLDVVKGV